MDINEFEKMVNQKEATIQTSYSNVMRKVYLWMTLALVITGITAYGVATSPAITTAIFSNRIIMWGLIIAEFGLVIGISGGINKLSLSTATLLFIIYSVINGAMLSTIFFVYTTTSIAKVFFISAATFGVTAMFGYTTKRDLNGLGRILFMALIGLVIATLVNMFLHSSGFDYILSFIGVGIFIGLTAWDSQKIRQNLVAATDAGYYGESLQKIALLGALSLYLDFINLFLYLLRIFGSNRN